MSVQKRNSRQGKTSIVRPCRRLPVLVSFFPSLKTRRFRKEAKKKEVDELNKTLHTLSSLLLTNTTIRKAQQGSTRFGSLKINSR
jgi:hypothetical protein